MSSQKTYEKANHNAIFRNLYFKTVLAAFTWPWAATITRHHLRWQKCLQQLKTPWKWHIICIYVQIMSAQLYFTICTTLFHHLGGSYIFKVDFCIELQRKEFFLKSLSNKFNAVFSSFFLTSSSLSQLCLAIYCRKIL